LTGVNSVRVISGPEILLISVSIVPPGVFNVAKFKRGVITIVLNVKQNNLKILFQFKFIKKEIYFNRLMAFS
jgi:hypothetical protein